MDYIHWNIDHTIFHIYGPIAIRWYSLFFLSGFLIGLEAFKRMALAEGKSTKYTDALLFYIIIGTIVGARLGHCLFYQPEYYLSNPLELLKTWKGGLASHGGFLGVIIAVAIFAKRNKSLSFFWLIDRISVFALMTGGFIRIGNLFNSGIIGKVTNVSWAFIFDKIDHYPRHPSQIYEALGYFAISGIVYMIYRASNRKPQPGKLFGLIMLMGFSFRAFVEIFKENQVQFENNLTFNMGQLLSIPYILVGLYLTLGLHNKKLKKA